jgi:hypothetical protein
VRGDCAAEVAAAAIIADQLEKLAIIDISINAMHAIETGPPQRSIGFSSDASSEQLRSNNVKGSNRQNMVIEDILEECTETGTGRLKKRKGKLW